MEKLTSSISLFQLLSLSENKGYEEDVLHKKIQSTDIE
jgi:hypothetical protein